MNKLIHVQFSNPVQSRKEILNGETYIVYPVIMMTEGVHSGSGGPTFYSTQELSNYYWTWNGMPVSINHPQDSDGSPVSCNDPQIYNTQVIGKIFNAIIEDNKLKAEAWLSESVLHSLGNDVAKILESNANLEVSTGLFCDIDNVTGNWNGEVYDAVATNIRPDHLALLPGGVGACSWSDGCGIRTNIQINKGGDMEKESLKYFQINEDVSEFKILQEMDIEYTSVVDSARMLIDSMDNDQYVYYMKKIYPDFIVYSVHGRETEGRKLYKRNYSIDENGKLAFNGDPIEVVIKESIETVINKQNKANKQKQNEGESMAKTMKECCIDKVDELIDNNENFTKDDRDTLLEMSEEAFAMVINVSKPIEKKKEKEIETNEQIEEETEEIETKKLTFDELLANADPEVAESIKNGHKIFQERKNELVKKIEAHESNSFTQEDLKLFSFDHLEKLASFIPEKKGTNYVGNVGSFQNNSSDDGEGVLPDMDFDFTSNE